MQRRALVLAAVAAFAPITAIARKRKHHHEPRPKKVVIEGPFAFVTRDFFLAEGRYEVIGQVRPESPSGGLFFVDLHGPNGFRDSLFIENPEGPVLIYEYSTVTQVPKSGKYFLNVEEADGPWKIRFYPR